MKIDWRKIEIENQNLSFRSACLLGEGWNSRAYLVNDEYVFRFPKRSDHWEELDREITFLEFAASRLPLAVPQYLKVSPNSPAAPCGYTVYRYLRGQALDADALSREKKSVAAETIATFLRTLHGLQPPPAIGSILPREDAYLVAQEYFAQTEREVAPKLPQSEAKVLRKHFDIYFSASENFFFQPAVLHADLSRDHVLMLGDSIVGVIDFGDVSWGDPDYDFMYLFVDFGQAFVQEVAQRYGHPDLERLWIKLQYFSLVDQIDTILYGAGQALEGQQEAAWRRLKRLLQSREYA